MSTLTIGPAQARLQTVPWQALEALGPVIATAVEEVLRGAPAERVLDRLLRQHRAFTADQRRATAEALFGVGLWRRRLAAQLGLDHPTPLQLLGALARDLGGCTDAPALLGISLPPPRPPPQDWPTLHSVPSWLAGELEAAVGPSDAPALAGALNLPGPVCLRPNRLRLTRDALAAQLSREGVATRPGTWAPDALVVTSDRPNLRGLSAFRDALFEVQDEGSQLLGDLLPLHRGDSVLDLCAGAGGKTLQLASRLEGQGSLHATDVDRASLDRLRVRADRAGARVALHAGPLPDALRVTAVLVDAPCSALGALRRGPDLRWRLDPATFDRWPAVQLGLLEQGARHLAPGGALAYGTCTLRRAENQGVLEAFLRVHPDFSVERPALPGDVLTPEGFLVTFPHRHGTDAFFGALLRREIA